MRVVVAVCVLGATVIAAAAAIHQWHPGWQPERTPAGRAVIQPAAPPVDLPLPTVGAPAERRNAPAAAGATARWTVPVGPGPEAGAGPAKVPAGAVTETISETIRAVAAEPDPNRPQSGSLSVAQVGYDDAGEVTLTGSASPGNTVRVSLNGQIVGEAEADAEGRWRLQPDRPVPAGQYRLQAEEFGGTGGMAATVSLPFAKADNTGDLPLPDRFVVQPGNNLWRLAERFYGDGLQYVMIVEANRSQIDNPDLIFPGQIFRIPPPASGE